MADSDDFPCRDYIRADLRPTERFAGTGAAAQRTAAAVHGPAAAAPRPAGALDWSERLATGIGLLDDQHREIFRWFGELDQAAAEHRTLLAVYTITRLNRYMRDHFAAEEAVMRAAGFPKLEQHVAEHRLFRGTLSKLQIESVGRDIAADTVEFLRTWLVDHICGHDMEYVPYLGWLNDPPS